MINIHRTSDMGVSKFVEACNFLEGNMAKVTESDLWNQLSGVEICIERVSCMINIITYLRIGRDTCTASLLHMVSDRS